MIIDTSSFASVPFLDTVRGSELVSNVVAAVMFSEHHTRKHL